MFDDTRLKHKRKMFRYNTKKSQKRMLKWIQYFNVKKFRKVVSFKVKPRHYFFKAILEATMPFLPIIFKAPKIVLTPLFPICLSVYFWSH